MPTPPSPLPSAAEANRALRAHVAGRVVWTAEALAELARLRGVWVEAARRDEREGVMPLVEDVGGRAARDDLTERAVVHNTFSHRSPSGMWWPRRTGAGGAVSAARSQHGYGPH